MAMPGTIRNVPQWLADPLGPLSLRLFYLPSVAPWLIRFIRAGTPSKVAARRAPCARCCSKGSRRSLRCCSSAGASDLIQRVGHLFVYRTLAGWQKDQAAWKLRADNGITWDEFDVDELRQLDPNLSREYREGRAGARERPHHEPASAGQQLGQRHSSVTAAALARRVVGFDVVDGRLQAVRCEDACHCRRCRGRCRRHLVKAIGRATRRPACRSRPSAATTS